MTRYLVGSVALLAVIFSGCARAWVHEEMQPDRSYRVVATGNGYADVDTVREAAKKRAALLCPKGHQLKTEIPEDSFRPSDTLIIVCKE